MRKLLFIVVLIWTALAIAQVGSGFKGRGGGAGTGVVTIADTNFVGTQGTFYYMTSDSGYYTYRPPWTLLESDTSSGVSIVDVRSEIADTSDALRTEWRSDISDSLATVETDTVLIRTIVGDTADVIRGEIGSAVTDSAYIKQVVADTAEVLRGEMGSGTADSSYATLFAGAKTGSPVSILEVKRDDIATTQDNAYGITLRNAKAALTGVRVQYSPPLIFDSYVWETTGSTSQNVKWRWQQVPLTGATATSQLNLNYSFNGGAYQATATFQFTSTGLGIKKTPGASYVLDVNGYIWTSKLETPWVSWGTGGALYGNAIYNSTLMRIGVCSSYDDMVGGDMIFQQGGNNAGNNMMRLAVGNKNTTVLGVDNGMLTLAATPAGVMTVGAEVLTNGDLTSGTGWDRTGDFALTSNKAVFTYATGTGTIFTTSAFATAAKGAKLYRLLYTTSASSLDGSPVLTVTNGFAETVATLSCSPTFAVGAKVAYFYSKSPAPTVFTLQLTGATSGAISIDALSVMEVTDGDFRALDDIIANDFRAVGTGLNVFADTSSVDDDYGFTSTFVTSYQDGLEIKFKAGVANTGACTLQINALGAKALKSLHNQDPADNYIEAGSYVYCIYDGTNFQMMQPDANP